MTEKRTPGGWRSVDAEARFRAMEDELWAEQWPVPPQALDVDTQYGRTRLYRWPGEGTPLVFLHGMGATSLAHTPYVKRLAGRACIGIDTIGDVGRSVPTEPPEDADALAVWLDETLAAAGIDVVHLVGTSYGGSLALNLAVRRPERIAAVTLIEPGGLADFRLARFLLWGTPMLFGALAPGPVRRRLARTRPLLDDPRLTKMTLLGQRKHPFGLPQFVLFSDDELRSVAVPTDVFIAGRSAPFDSRVVADRALLIPGATVEVVADAGHELSWTHVDLVVDRLTQTDRCPPG